VARELRSREEGRERKNKHERERPRTVVVEKPRSTVEDLAPSWQPRRHVVQRAFYLDMVKPVVLR
jgi:hypothetical protein